MAWARQSGRYSCRTVLLILVLLNNALSITDKSPLPIENEMVSEVINISFTTIVSLAAWWKNNSFTEASLEADKLMNKQKKK